MFGTTQRSHSLPITSTVNVRYPCPGFQSDQDSRRYPRQYTVHSHLMHTSQHFLKHVSMYPCTLPHPSQSHTRLFQEHCLFSHRLSPRLRQLDPRRISVKNVSRLQRLQSTLARVVTCQRGRISICKTLQLLHRLPIK